MPGQRFQLGDYWLSQRPGSANWYATYFDKRSRQTKRTSLGTSDFQQAQLKLAELVTKKAELKNVPLIEMPLATVLIRYWERRGSKAASHETQRFASKLWNEFWGEATVAELSIPRQQEFIIWLKERGYKNSYVDRILSVGRAALNLAWKWGEIPTAPFVMHLSDKSDAKEAYRLKEHEMRSFLSAVQTWPHLYAFSMLMLNTLSRPAAILDLAPAQVDLENRRINLNPKGRKQTKKYRPIVPITDTLLPLVRDRSVVRFVTWHGNPIQSIKKTFAKAVKAAGLPTDVTPYSLRHTMAAELRRRGVPAWEVEGLLGHRRPGVTETYAEFSPDYLSQGRAAIDAYFDDLALELPTHPADCVPVACQPIPSTISRKENFMNDFNWKTGAGEGIRTLDPNLGKVVLYP